MYVLALLTLASVMTYGSEVNNHDISNLYERHRGVINTIPFVGMGTAGLGENTESIACLGLQAGFRLLDTAEAVEWYNETALGHALRECETLQALAHETNVTTRKFDYDEVIIVTKVHPRSFGVKRMREALSASSALIYTQQPQRPLDIVLLHSPFCWPGHCSAEEEKVPWQTAWRNLEVLQKEDRVRSIGVSNFDASLLTELLKMSNRKVAVVQNWMDPFHQDQEVRHIAREHGIVYMAYSSFGTQWQGRFGDRNLVLGNEVLQEVLVILFKCFEGNF